MVARSVVIAAGLAVAAFAAPLSAQSPWPIKQFEVVSVEPAGDVRGQGTLAQLFQEMVRAFRIRSPGIDPDIPGLVQSIPIGPVLRTEIESYLHTAAVQLEGWGFSPPALDPIVTLDSGESAFRVYLVEGLTGSAGEYRQDCTGGTERVILLDASDVLTGERLNVRGYETLGHELFHAVQGAAPFHGCRTGAVGGWVIEGTAKAIGYDLLELQRPGLLVGRLPERWGARDYTLPLPVPAAQSGTTLRALAYATSSWWRYMAEYGAALAAGGLPPGPGENPFDYRYLAQMLAMPSVPRDCGGAGASCDSEMRWMDAGSSSTVNRSLREAFANFAQVLPLYGGRRQAVTLSGSQLDGPGWRREVFRATGGCPRVALDPPRASAVHRSRIPLFYQSSVQCFKVVVGNSLALGDSMALVSVRLDAPPGQRALENLTAALAGPPYESERAQVVESVGTGALNTTWVFQIRENDSSFVMLTNLADDPANTIDLEELPVTFRIEGHAAMSDGSASGGSASGPTGADVDRPFPIELDRVVRSHVFIFGENRCRLQFEFSNSRTGDVMAFMMDHLGRIVPGEYPIHNPGQGGFDFDYLEDNPGVFTTTFGYGPGNGMTNGFTYGYIGRAGSITLDHVSSKLVTGSLSVTGERSVCRDAEGRTWSLTNRFQCPAPDGIVAEAIFSAVPRGAANREPSSRCFAASGG